MTESPAHSAPVWQSRALIGAAIAGAGASSLGSAVYAFQTASMAQRFQVFGVGIPTDAVLKTTMAVVADLCVVFGPVVIGYLWRTGRKGLRNQAWLGVAAGAIALAIASSNLAGYMAWTRQQHMAEAVRVSERYQTALGHLRSGGYVSTDDQRELDRGEAPSNADRDLGDFSKAAFVLIVVAAMSASYRLPYRAQRKTKKPRQKRPPDVRGKLHVA